MNPDKPAAEGTTCIRNADWVIAWDAENARHCYMTNVDVAFAGDTIIHVGETRHAPVDHEIDGTGLCVIPGLVNIHAHPTNQPITRGVREEMGNPKLYGTALYDRTELWAADEDGLLAGAEAAYGELLASGVTTVVDYAARVPEGWIALMARSGLRVFAAPAFRDARWKVNNQSRLDYEWDEAAGRAAFDHAIGLVNEALDHPCGRLSGVIAPAQVDTCTLETLRRSHALAGEMGLMWQPHAGQTLPEFHEIVRRHGTTPVQWLAEIEVLGPSSTLAHGIFTDVHPWTHWRPRRDLPTLADTGATIAHCPVVFSRYGQTMRSLGGYFRAGVNMGMGTDTAPHNLIEEIRQALTLSRIASEDIEDLSMAQVFGAATIGGAQALGRDDIGRIAPGARADLVLVDLSVPTMRPMRDPLRSLIFGAADRAVRDVYVDGKLALAEGKPLTLDIEDALVRLQSSQDRAEAAIPDRDPAGRTGQDISPLALPRG